MIGSIVPNGQFSDTFCKLPLWQGIRHGLGVLSAHSSYKSVWRTGGVVVAVAVCLVSAMHFGLVYHGQMSGWVGTCGLLVPVWEPLKPLG